MMDTTLFDHRRSPSQTDNDRPKMSGGPTGLKPVLVQCKQMIGNANPSVTLDAEPTPGNLLVAIGTHRNNAPNAINGYTMIANSNTNGSTYSGTMAAWKIVQPGESKTQQPFLIGSIENSFALFEIEGGQGTLLLSAVKEVVGNPAITGFLSPTDLLVGQAQQSRTDAPFTLSGDITSVLDNLAAKQGQDGPFRTQAFVYDPTDPDKRDYSLTMTTTDANARSIITAIRVSSVPENQGRLAISRYVSSVSTVRMPVGNYYFEAEALAVVGTPGVGIADITYEHGWSVLGTNNLNVVYNNNGQVRLNNATLATIANWGAGDVIGVAVNVPAKQIWFRVNGGAWNNDGTANPTTMVGGIDISGMVGGRPTPALSFSTPGSVFFGNFADVDFKNPAPSGYSATDAVNIGQVMVSQQAPIPYGPATTDISYMISAGPEETTARLISFPAGPVKTIAGEVQEDGVGVEGRLVRIYNKRTGEYISEARTNPDGSFVMPTRDPELPHFVVAFDDPEYNAKVYDNVMPS